MIRVQLLGRFRMYDETRCLNEEAIHSPMITKLLVYMICNKNHIVTLEQLTEALWTDEESENPYGALKNMMYRLRGTLRKVWLVEDFILTGRGYYQWNPEIAVEVDEEVFFSLCRRAERAEKQEDKDFLREQAILGCNGRFLNGVVSQYWMEVRLREDHACYMKAVMELTKSLEHRRAYEKLEEICRRAVRMDPQEETVYCRLVRALMHQGKTAEAMKYCQEAESYLYSRMGIRPSKELRGLFAELMKQGHISGSDIETIQEEMDADTEGEEKSGVLFCEYGVFQQIYRMESQRVGTLGFTEWLCLVTLHIPEETAEDTERILLNDGMEKMETVLGRVLPAGTAVTKYSPDQYLFLLPCLPYEEAKMMTKQIAYRFYTADRKGKVQVLSDLKELYQEPRELEKIN